MRIDQATRLRQQLARQTAIQKAQTIAIASGKGGAGKSNVAVNFSLELLKHGKNVLLFDLDMGLGNVDILLGLDPEMTIIDMLRHRLSIQDVIETGPCGLSYIAGGSALNDFLRLRVPERDYFFQAFDALTSLYDFIILDIGAGVSEDIQAFPELSFVQKLKIKLAGDY